MSDEANFLFCLPQDIFTQILLRLPIKSLIICSCVCKTWNSIINSPSFVSSHLDEKDRNPLCLVQLCSLPLNTARDSFFLCSNDLEFSMRERLHFPYKIQSGFQVVASCNGLVCLMNGKFHYAPEGLILWNPMIRKSVIINDDCLDLLEVVGLGFDSRTGDYKVLTFIEEFGQETSSLMVNLYSLKANSWKQLPGVSVMRNREINRSMTFLNGSLHFIAMRGRHKNPRIVILGFDLSDEVFHEIMLPRCILDGNSRHISHPNFRFHLFTCGESLAVSWLRSSVKVMDIWVMKEYGVEGSWTQLSTVRLGGVSVAIDLEITGFLFREEEHVLLSVSSYDDDEARTVYLHDLKSKETKKLKTVGKHGCFFLDNYVESLVLLDKGDDLSKHYETEKGDDATSGNNSSINADLVMPASSCATSS